MFKCCHFCTTPSIIIQRWKVGSMLANSCVFWWALLSLAEQRSHDQEGRDSQLSSQVLFRQTFAPFALFLSKMNIPVVDFSSYSLEKENVPDEQLHALVTELRAAFTEVGFVFLQNYGIEQELVSRIWHSSSQTGVSALMCVFGFRWIVPWKRQSSSFCSLMKRNSLSAEETSKTASIMAGFLWRRRGVT